MTQGPLSGAPRVHVAASPPLQQVDAGEGVVFTLTVTNLSDENQAQSIAVEGLPRAWVTIAFDEAREALPREQRNAIVTIAAPEGSQTAAMRFRAIARGGEEMSVTDCVVEVSGTTPEVDELVEELDQRPPPPGLALAPAEASLEAGGEANAELRLTVRNVGTRETVYSLALGGFEPTWYELPAQLRVAAGETIDTQLLLHPTVSAGDGVYPFMIRAVVDAFPDVMSDITGELTILGPSAVPTEPAEAAPSQARATAAAAIAPPELTLGPETTFRFGPGEITSDAAVGVENRSRLLEGYTISVEGLPDGWYALPVREIRLDPGATQQLVLRLTPKPGSQHPAGDYPFRVRVTPHGSTDGFAEVGGLISVEGTTAFDALVAPLQGQGRREQYKVTLRNIGTQPVGLLIEGSDPGGMSRFDYPPAAHPRARRGARAAGEGWDPPQPLRGQDQQLRLRAARAARGRRVQLRAHLRRAARPPALARIHRTRDPIRLPGHANRCPSEAGMMVCEQPIDPEQGAPDRCDHRIASTGLKRPSTTTAWWPTRGCCCRPRSPSISVCSSSSTPTSTSGLPRVGRTSGTSC